jgi:hexosaminidase
VLAGRAPLDLGYDRPAMRKSLAMLSILFLACGGTASEPGPKSIAEIGLVPLPATVEPHAGAFELTPSTHVVASPGAEDVAARLVEVLRPSTGLALPIAGGAPGYGDVALTLDAGAKTGDEGYTLDVRDTGVTIVAARPAGLFYGCQTLRQLLPPEVEQREPVPGVPWRAPAVSIQDAPRFAWRGTMLDVARHFFSVGDVERYIDLAAYHKLNRVHLHLTDDQGWRVPIDAWPDLTAVGGATEVGGGAAGAYTKADVADLVGFAEARFVVLVPEVDMPGHVNAALTSYGELNPSGLPAAPYTGTNVGFSSLWLEGPATAGFVEDVLAEVAAMFPGPYAHIGGDEAAATPPAEYANFVGSWPRRRRTRTST